MELPGGAESRLESSRDWAIALGGMGRRGSSPWRSVSLELSKVEISVHLFAFGGRNKPFVWDARQGLERAAHAFPIPASCLRRA